MSEKNPFQTTSAAEFREIAQAAHASGRLAELITAIQSRIERYRATLEVHEAARDFQKIRDTKKLITNLEGRLEIARTFETGKAIDG